ATLRAWIDDGAAETATDIPSEPPSASGDTWNETIAAFFDPTCTGCHGTSGGLDLSSYAAALAGGSLGPGVVPGDAEASVIVRVMEAGGHPQQLSAEDLATLRAWIDGGAAETAAPTEPPAAAGEMWAESIGAFFDPTCTACHGDTAQLSGLRLTSFEDALAGGSLGPGVVPGDADGSVIVQVMEAGGHPQQLSAEDLAALRAWIEAGVP
ncbi:MAG: hypothetical protein KJN71_08550, partial [Acidimicrobiia bacterium]|nr:hypothetical protein [Acidimicrobiia bacterium]